MKESMVDLIRKIILFKSIKIMNRLYVTLSFKWYDIWVGIFVDTKKRKIYICPLPMVVIIVSWGIWYLSAYPKNKEPIYY